jgi:hypothetical protein
MYESGKIRLIETILRWEGGTKENDGRVEFNYGIFLNVTMH